MSRYIPGNQKHLTLEDRKYIEKSLNEGLAFKEIARYLCKDPTTISKEILLVRDVQLLVEAVLQVIGLKPRFRIQVPHKPRSPKGIPDLSHQEVPDLLLRILIRCLAAYHICLATSKTMEACCLSAAAPYTSADGSLSAYKR